MMIADKIDDFVVKSINKRYKLPATILSITKQKYNDRAYEYNIKIQYDEIIHTRIIYIRNEEDYKEKIAQEARQLAMVKLTNKYFDNFVNRTTKKKKKNADK